METASTLEVARTLKDKLLSEEVDERWLLSRKILKTLIMLQTYQKNYEGMKSTDNYGFVEFFDGGDPMTEDDVKKLKEAKSIDKQIGKILRERRLAKK